MPAQGERCDRRGHRPHGGTATPRAPSSSCRATCFVASSDCPRPGKKGSPRRGLDSLDSWLSVVKQGRKRTTRKDPKIREQTSRPLPRMKPEHQNSMPRTIGRRHQPTSRHSKPGGDMRLNLGTVARKGQREANKSFSAFWA